MLFHICADQDWRRAQTDGRYVPEAVARDGFVHCSDPGTVHLPANALYAGRRDLVLLQIDPARLSAQVKWEPGTNEDAAGPWFPHIYGEVNLDSVVAVHPFVPNDDGGFSPVQPDVIQLMETKATELR